MIKIFYIFGILRKTNYFIYIIYKLLYFNKSWFLYARLYLILIILSTNLFPNKHVPPNWILREYGALECTRKTSWFDVKISHSFDRQQMTLASIDSVENTGRSQIAVCGSINGGWRAKDTISFLQDE